MSESQAKPPIGMVPKSIWLEMRAKDIRKAIKSYEGENLSIPEEWIEELKENISMRQSLSLQRMQELEVETKRHKEGYTSAPKELEVTEETIFEGGTINKLTKSEVEGNTHVKGSRQFVPGTLRRTDFNDHLQVIDVDATDGTAWYAIAERNLNHRIAEWIQVPPLP